MRTNISEVSGNMAKISTELFTGAAKNNKAPNSQNDQATANIDQKQKDIIAKEATAKLEQEKLEIKAITEVDDAKLVEAIETVTAFLQPQLRNVNFAHHQSSGKTVVSIFDAESKELIKQFPSEKILDMADRIKGLQDEITGKTGMLFDDKV